MPHKLEDNTLINPALLRRAIGEAEEDGGDGRHFLVIQKADRSYLEHNPYSPEPDGLQKVYAQTCLTLLNDELHHDGAWVALFTHPDVTIGWVLEYQRITFLFLDADGDVRFPFTWQQGAQSDEKDWAELIANGTHSLAHCAEHAWRLWRESMDVLDAQPDQTYRRALGEEAPTKH